ncbi:hypothetical protein AX16_003385 [Volvariella volvacea WC 439]|nr:hypothetical protein AX16_003385 [Volvariella volvacea WC 439]
MERIMERTRCMVSASCSSRLLASQLFVNTGNSLIKMGRAHSKIATIQEAYALTFQDTYMIPLQKFGERIKEYDQQRKKLDSRRLSYDAAVAKFEKLKGGKKEKEKKEAEEEMERAKQRFEDTEEEVRGQMHDIQEEEISQHRQLANLLDIEINFVSQYLEVLKEVKAEWNDSGVAPHSRRPSRAPSLLRPKSRSGSVRSKRSARSESAHASETEDLQRTPSKRRLSKSESTPSRPPSRPVSRLSRKRSDSNAAAGSDKETEKDKSDGKAEKQGRRLSVTGWASSAVGSMTSLGKKNKDKDKFSALQENDEQEGQKGLKRSNSNHSMGIMSHIRNKSRDTPTSSPKIPPRILKPPSLQDKKVVRALYDFAGAPDELAFKTGDEIVVLNEVLDDWWMGEIGGRTGLFPTAYVEVVPVPRKPALPPRISRQDSTSKQAIRSIPSEDELNREEESMDGHSTDDGEDYHDFSAPPLTPRHSPFYGVPSDTVSITSSNADEELHLQQQQQQVQNSKILAAAVMGDAKRPAPAAPQIARSATADSGLIATKKAPPPPPPRRATTLNGGGTPPIPERPNRPTITRTHSASSGSTPPSSFEGRDRYYDASPFESASELTTLNTNGNGNGNTNGCNDFKQNPFKPKGMCSNCFSYH